ncbi:ACP S-malonyltransferase [Facklamia sp. DSM 111018]|uniref:Malonyl CoA-acyl carrier protein transacylase n=1 Tax=Facklamia lactis TaxID=2749967 RepID=A0ABS0LUZ1_9LACT|nr:ACP S-malonyltransferase [Facklamia lactis]MBG9981343.1 ACP S-malonyltransferase [Facklamia lactis]MBG9987181.1 ACP S-malonyltransferase [Facklamia lactis]
MSLGIIFNGQGAHYPGMGLDFIQEYPESLRVVEKAQVISQLPLINWLKEGGNVLSETRNAQPAIASVSMAIYQAIRPQLPAVSYMAGLSLGEYSALMASGMLTFEQGIDLLVKRGELMSAHCSKIAESYPSGLVAVVGIKSELVQRLVDHTECDELWLANFNAATQTVVAGSQKHLKVLRKVAKKTGIKGVIPLKVEGPFHSPLMAPIQNEYHEILQTYHFESSQIPVISNTDLSIHQPDKVKKLLTQHLVSPVQWKQTIDLMISKGITHLIQIGPGDTLVKMLSRDRVSINTLTVDKIEDVAKIKAFIQEEQSK